jgi:glycosyltransferase involved in cell wall biosynthesis
MQKRFDRYLEWGDFCGIYFGFDQSRLMKQEANRRLVYLAAVGDANSPITWSGIPYHFLQAGKKANLFDDGLALNADSSAFQLRRIAWNLWQMFKGERPGGYQYSIGFLERLWFPYIRQIRNSVVVNCFQLYPPSVVADETIEKWFFIDQTLGQLFDHYGLRSTVGRRIAAEAQRRERQGYHAAQGIIAHSKWAANSLTNDYEVPADRVHVVVPGANLAADEYASWEFEEEKRRLSEFGRDGLPLRLVFVGKEWERKGLDRLLRAVQIARGAGANVTLRVIGCQRENLPADLRKVAGVEWFGFINKTTEAKRFLPAVSDCDVGCLLSRAEAGGIAIREYHALGLPVLGTDAGGAPEHMIPEASIIIPADAPPEKIAETVLALGQNPAWLEQLQRMAWLNRHSASWNTSVDAVLDLRRSNHPTRHTANVYARVF